MKKIKSPALRKALRVLCVIILAMTLFFGGFTYWLNVPYNRQYVQSAAEKLLPVSMLPQGGDVQRIHFLNTGNSDAILIEWRFEGESFFALVDGAEDTAYPADKEKLALEGFEDYVLDYLRRVAADDDGKIHLRFMVATHVHSDHTGGLDTIIAAEDVIVDTLYLKRYNHDDKNSLEYTWDNVEVYEQLLTAAEENNVEIIQDVPAEPFEIGNLAFQFFNTEYRKNLGGGENDQSLGLLVTLGSKRAFLAGDINNWSLAERDIAKAIGQIDLLKAGHHGHFGSGSVYFGAGLKPAHVVVTARKVPLTTLSNFALFARSEIYSTGVSGGVVADFADGEINFYSIGDFDTGAEAVSYQTEAS
ncbi:MAG: MBL fold metallo-hydrolase [Oscillospiraceae bacterium]|nr:MBL fold metallo-hydrolase [Oscillospiraceae bacterium]